MPDKVGRTALLAGLLLGAGPAWSIPAGEDAAAWAFRTYGPEAEYVILRDGNEIGQHRLAFERQDDGLKVDVSNRLSIGFLGLTVYSFDYRSRAFWRGGALQSLTVDIDDDGDTRSLTVSPDGSDLIVDGPRGRFSASPTLLPTNHWNPAVLSRDRVLNTLTGGINRVTIAPQGREPVTTGQGTLMATRYVYDGQLRIESWYDDQGRWVKLRFRGKDGSTIEYLCQACGAASGTQAG